MDKHSIFSGIHLPAYVVAIDPYGPEAHQDFALIQQSDIESPRAAWTVSKSFGV